MSNKISIFKIIAIIIVSVGLYGFSYSTYEQKELSGVNVKVYPVNQPFIDELMITNLLTKNQDKASDELITNLNLAKLEKQISQNKMVANASVFLTVDGILSANVYQRKPVARLVTDEAFMYIDQKGKLMPTSANFSARVPLAYGFNETEIKKYDFIFNYIHKDQLYKKLITEISLKKDLGIVLATRLNNFTIQLGKHENLVKKLNNFKAFYQYLNKKDQLNHYNTIDLRFGKQVIASKN